MQEKKVASKTVILKMMQKEREKNTYNSVEVQGLA
jgi:hypothetical protein